jgi:hypothetical protein
MSEALALERFTGSIRKNYALGEPTSTAVSTKSFTTAHYVTPRPKEGFWTSALAERTPASWSFATPRANQLRLISLTSAIDQPIPINWSNQFVEDLKSPAEASNFSPSVTDNAIVEIGTDVILEARLDELEGHWRQETSFLSSITAKVDNQWYQEIIALGPPVVPFLLRKLRQRPDHWFEALRKLTLENPVRNRPEIRGDMKAMSECWVAWGKERGYI